MKRQISVSIFCAILLVALVWLYIKFYNDRKLIEEDITTEKTVEQVDESMMISQEYITYLFYIKEEYGRIVVYSMKNEEVYMETGIETYTLPAAIQEDLKSGIFFKTEGELFDFLESYSS